MSDGTPECSLIQEVLCVLRRDPLSRHPARLALVAALTFLSAGASGQAESWEELNDRVAMLCRRGNTSEAIEVAGQALALAEQAYGSSHTNVAQALNNLGALYHAAGRRAEAEPLFLRALTMREQLLGSNHTDVAVSLNNLAGLCRAEGRLREAEPLYRRALEIWRNTPDSNAQVVVVLQNLAMLYRKMAAECSAEAARIRALSAEDQPAPPPVPPPPADPAAP